MERFSQRQIKTGIVISSQSKHRGVLFTPCDVLVGRTKLIFPRNSTMTTSTDRLCLMNFHIFIQTKAPASLVAATGFNKCGVTVLCFGYSGEPIFYFRNFKNVVLAKMHVITIFFSNWLNRREQYAINYL